MTYSTDLLKAELTRDEDKRLLPYVDTVGKVTIGIGRNLSQRGISNAESDYFYANDVAGCEADLDRNVSWWRNQTDARQRALMNMIFNLGWPKLSEFKVMLAHWEAGDYEGAALAALDSNWAGQVKDRAQRIATMIKEG